MAAVLKKSYNLAQKRMMVQLLVAGRKKKKYSNIEVIPIVDVKKSHDLYNSHIELQGSPATA